MLLIVARHEKEEYQAFGKRNTSKKNRPVLSVLKSEYSGVHNQLGTSGMISEKCYSKRILSQKGGFVGTPSPNPTPPHPLEDGHEDESLCGYVQAKGDIPDSEGS